MFFVGFFDEFTFLIFNTDEFVDPFFYKFYSLCLVLSFPLAVFSIFTCIWDQQGFFWDRTG